MVPSAGRIPHAVAEEGNSVGTGPGFLPSTATKKRAAPVARLNAGRPASLGSDAGPGPMSR
jgi:hypothetical protein